MGILPLLQSLATVFFPMDRFPDVLPHIVPGAFPSCTYLFFLGKCNYVSNHSITDFLLYVILQQEEARVHVGSTSLVDKVFRPVIRKVPCRKAHFC
jgi:hypothetical protein